MDRVVDMFPVNLAQQINEDVIQEGMSHTANCSYTSVYNSTQTKRVDD